MDHKTWSVYTILGDGELQEGSVWEAAMAAAHHRLDNLTAIVDRNFLQIDGPTEKVMSLEPLEDKWKAFGWNVLTCDGHDHIEFILKCEEAKRCMGKPSVILARTVMGKGIPTIENNHRWHGKAPSEEESIRFLNELT